jgi:hypothetical protein
LYQTDHYLKMKKMVDKAVIVTFVTLDYLERETKFATFGILKEYRVEYSDSTPLIVIQKEDGSIMCFNVNGCDVPDDPNEEPEEQDGDKSRTKCFNFLLELYSNDPQDENRGGLIYSNEEMEQDILSNE